MRFPECCFIDVARGGVNRRNNVQDIREAVKQKNDRPDCYFTVYRFPPEYLEHMRERGSVGGYAGPAFADYLPLDIDRDNDLDSAHRDAVKLAVVLHELFEVDVSKLRYFFSGAKGYHILIPTHLMGDVTPSPLLPTAFRTMAEGIASLADVQIDRVIYDVNRLFRLADSQHGGSKLWKVELSWEELSTLGCEKHREIARQPRAWKWEPHDLEPTDALAEYFAKHMLEAEEARSRPSSGRLVGDGATGRIADVLSPSYAKGVRHDLVLAFAGYAAKRSLPREAALGVVEHLASGDDELDDRLRAVEDTYDRVRDGADVRGYAELMQLMREDDLADLKTLLGDVRPERPGTNGTKPPAESEPRPERIGLHHVYDPDRAGETYLKYAKELVHRRVQIGIPTIDRMMRGLMPGTVTTLIAKSRVGKSMVAQNIRRTIANSVRDAATVFFSLEMPIQLVWERDAQYALNMTGSAVERVMREADEHVVRDKIAQVSRTIPRSYTVTAPGLTLEDMFEYCTLIRETFGRPIAAALVDYLSLIRGPGKDIYNTVSTIARGLKGFAKNLDAPVIVLVQVRRRGADGDKVDGSSPPSLEDARDSGAIEEGSDSVIGAWRPRLDELTGDDRMGFRLLKNRMGIGGKHDVICRVDWVRLEITELVEDDRDLH